MPRVDYTSTGHKMVDSKSIETFPTRSTGQKGRNQYMTDESIGLTFLPLSSISVIVQALPFSHGCTQIYLDVWANGEALLIRVAYNQNRARSKRIQISQPRKMDVIKTAIARIAIFLRGEPPVRRQVSFWNGCSAQIHTRNRHKANRCKELRKIHRQKVRSLFFFEKSLDFFL